MKIIITCFCALLLVGILPTILHAQCDIDGCPEIVPTLQYGFGTHIDPRSDYSYAAFDPKLQTTVYYYAFGRGENPDATCLHIFFDVRNCGQAIGKMTIELLRDYVYCENDPDQLITINDYSDPKKTRSLGSYPSTRSLPISYTPSPVIQPYDTGSIKLGFCRLCECHTEGPGVGVMKIKVTLFKEDGVTPVCPHPIIFEFNLQGCPRPSTVPGDNQLTPSSLLSIAPNPATNTLTIMSPATVNGASLRLVAADGHDALSIPIRSASEPVSTQLDIRSIPSGTYMVVLDGIIGGQRNVITQKVVVIKP
jgi:hypothetical protein